MIRDSRFEIENALLVINQLVDNIGQGPKNEARANNHAIVF